MFRLAAKLLKTVMLNFMSYYKTFIITKKMHILQSVASLKVYVTFLYVLIILCGQWVNGL